MQATRKIGYLFAIITSIAYAIWYIGSGALLKIGGSTVSPIFILFAIESISAVLVFITAWGNIRFDKLSDLKYPLLSGIFFVVANYIFYITIVNSGVPAAGAFASAEIVIFTALLWLTSGKGANASTYTLGALLIAVGLIWESFIIHNGVYVLSSTTVILGVLIATFAGVATYFYYLSVKVIENRSTTMFYQQGLQAVAFFILLNLTGGHYPSLNISWYFWPLLVGVGAVLFLSFFFETHMMKILVRFSRGTVATGYILSDMELLPVLFYFLVVNPSSWVIYAPGLVVITIGIVLLEWK